MLDDLRARSPLAVWLIATAFWIFIGLLYIGQIWWLTRTPGARVSLTPATWVWQFGFYLSWIPLTVVIWRLTGRWSAAEAGWLRFIAQHVALLLMVMAVQATAVTVVAKLILSEREPVLTAVTSQMRGRMVQETIMYLAVVMTSQALLMYDRSRRRELQAAQLAAQLSAVQLASLRAQLHPHFLFNSLHTIASLVRDQRNGAAVTLISEMSELLRRVLDTTADTHAIEDELAIARTYLDVHKVRFSDRLTADTSIDPSAAGARVPVLIVQPLVDNALRHGLANQVAPGHVAVRVTREGGELVIQVDDTGVGAAADWRPDRVNGTGLANISGRLRALYSGRASLSAGPRSNQGFGVTIRLPFVT